MSWVVNVWINSMVRVWSGGKRLLVRVSGVMMKLVIRLFSIRCCGILGDRVMLVELMFLIVNLKC